MARRDLGLYLYDNNNRPARDAQGRLIVLDTGWGIAEQVTLNETDTRWVDMVAQSSCATIDPTTIARSVTLASAAGQMLAADTVYEARQHGSRPTRATAQGDQQRQQRGRICDPLARQG